MSTKTKALTVPSLKEFKTPGFKSPPPPASLFQGCDTIHGGGCNTAVEGQSERTGGISTFSVHVTEDVNSLYSALGISLAVSVGFGQFASVDAKCQFVKNLNLTSHSLNVVARATHVEGRTTATDYNLKESITAPSGAELKKFFQYYGDSFVSSVTKGAEYYAVYTFYAWSAKEKNEIKAQLNAKKVSTSGDLQAVIEKVKENTHTRVIFDQAVEGIARPEFPDEANIIEYAREFSKLTIDSPVILSFDTTGYERVEGVDPDAFSPIVKNREYFCGSGRVPGLGDELVRVVELKNQLTSFQRVYEFYGGFQDDAVKTGLQKAANDEEAINTQIGDFADDPTGTFVRPALASLERGTPTLNYEIVPVDAHGGSGGDPFNDVGKNITAHLQGQTQISAVQLRSGVGTLPTPWYRPPAKTSIIHALRTSYRDDAGNAWTEEHGGGGGDLGDELVLSPRQFLKKITGRSGLYVDQLCFESPDGRSVKAGGEGGASFAWSAENADILLGFAGRSGAYLDEIRPVVVRLESASWPKP